ncbi:hypothetical protein GCM10023092_05210 [Rurimicrobium arvi]|uniref:Histidine kinase domain-containing protein n=2 Tax=Rurimicrobium arvi TaxID=2049916 RepID=A0ABP8MJV5_9BACT
MLALLLTAAAGVRAQRLPFVNYSTAQGMVHNRTHTINQDGKGYIWIGTDLGINRYDGRTFKHFPAPAVKHYFARYSVRIGDKVLFAMDGIGLALCLGDSVQFICPKNLKPLNISGTAALSDRSFLFNEWQNGVVKMDEKGNAQVLHLPAIASNNSFVDMFRDSKGIIWLMSGSGLIVFPENDPAAARKLKALGNAYINCVRESRDGYIYIASFRGVFRISPQQRSQLSDAAIEPVFNKNQEVTAIAFDNTNHVWLSTVYDGIYKCDASGRNLDHYTIRNGLISQNTWNIFCDRENNIWIGTENGISKLPDHQFMSFDFSQVDFQSVKSSLHWDDSTMLLSNVMDIYCLRGSQLQRLKGFHSGIGYRSHILDKSPDGYLWVSKSVPLPAGNFKVYTLSFKFNGEQLTDSIAVSKLPGGPNEIFGRRGMISLPGNACLISTDKGMKVYRDKHFYPVVRTDSLPVNSLCSINSQSFWALLDNRKLVRYKILPLNAGADSFRLQTLEEDTSILNGKPVNSLFRDSRNRIWCYGVQCGAVILHLNPDGSIHHASVPGLSAFSSEIFNDISEDAKGHIWVATSAGLDEVTEDKNKFEVKRDRFGGRLCGKNIFFVTPFRAGLMVGSTGCAGIIGLQEEEDAYRPEVYITDLRINEITRRNLLYLELPELHPEEDNLRFSFTGIYFKDENLIRYAYMLEGIDKQWSTPSPEHMVTYSHLPPGKYIFHVKALAPDGLWSAKEAVFSFSIDSPFYTRWWFILLCTGACTGMLYAIYRYRIDQLLAIQQIRQSISKDLHDDIGATVSSISILANMANSDLVSEQKRRQFLDTIQDESKHVTESLSDIVWSISPKNDTLDIMFARMQRYASELFEAKNISYQFRLPEDISNIAFPMNRRQHVYLIFKEAVNNLVKYAGAGHADISVSVEDELFIMQISDDGSGFDIDSITPGNGIINMRKRAQEAGALLAIISKPGAGTRIRFMLRM